MTITTELGGYSPHDAADISLCKHVYECLEHNYPGHDWLVGANSDAGIVTIDLPYTKPLRLRNYGYVLHMSSTDAPDARRRIRHAGGELLERFGLARGGATEQSCARALQHGLDID